MKRLLLLLALPPALLSCRVVQHAHTDQVISGNAAPPIQTELLSSVPVRIDHESLKINGPVYDSASLRQDRYRQAFDLLAAMLDGNASPSFKNAVFAVENAWEEGKLDREVYDWQIEQLLVLTTIYEQTHGPDFSYDFSDRDTILRHASLFKALKDTITIDFDGVQLSHLPMTYDFEDFNGAKSWNNTFVSSLLATGKGNCQALAYLYKILSDESRMPAYLALAPNHIYITRSSKKTGKYNTELTNGSFPTDAWIMASGYISVEALRNRLYMQPLNDQQALSLCLLDLAKGYEEKFGIGNGDFMLRCCDKALAVFPDCINAKLLKARVLESRIADNNLSAAIEHQQLVAAIHRSGYRKMPEEMYLRWLSGQSSDIAQPEQPRSPERYDPFGSFEHRNVSTPTATLSKGVYNEFFQADTLTAIGNALLDTRTLAVVGFAEETAFAVTPEMAYRFMAVDPLAANYPHNSPYAFSENRVIDAIELEGLEQIHYTLTLDEKTRKPKITNYKREESELLKDPFTGNYVTFESHIIYNGVAYTFRGRWDNPEDVKRVAEFRANPDDPKWNIYKDAAKEALQQAFEGVIAVTPFGVLKKTITPPSTLKSSEAAKLSPSSQRALAGLKKQLEAHKIKLEQYKKNPDKFDNKGFLKGKTVEERQKIIDSRIKSLENQIKTFEKDIKAIESGQKVPLQK